jgi:hypothetical protein
MSALREKAFHINKSGCPAAAAARAHSHAAFSLFFISLSFSLCALGRLILYTRVYVRVHIVHSHSLRELLVPLTVYFIYNLCERAACRHAPNLCPAPAAGQCMCKILFGDVLADRVNLSSPVYPENEFVSHT